MSKHDAEIRRQVASYKLWSDLDPDVDVVVSADRQELKDGERLEGVFREIEQRLGDAGFDETSIWSVKEVSMEFASNAMLHGQGRRAKQELLVVSRRGTNLRVWLFGYGSQDQIRRLMQIVAAISGIATPPNHREKLLDRRNKDLLRRLNLPDSSHRGAGMGMITVAALSSEVLRVIPGPPGNPASFLLRSSI